MSLRLSALVSLVVASAAAGHGQPVNDMAPRIWTVTLTGTVDGSGEFQFTRRNLTYRHKHWQPTTNVSFNGQPWSDLSQSPEAWTDHRGQLDLSQAWVVRRSGRDIVGLEKSARGFNVFVADSPNGADQYSITIAIPLREQSVGED